MWTGGNISILVHLLVSKGLSQCEKVRRQRGVSLGQGGPLDRGDGKHKAGVWSMDKPNLFFFAIGILEKNDHYTLPLVN